MWSLGRNLKWTSRWSHTHTHTRSSKQCLFLIWPINQSIEATPEKKLDHHSVHTEWIVTQHSNVVRAKTYMAYAGQTSESDATDRERGRATSADVWKLPTVAFCSSYRSKFDPRFDQSNKFVVESGTTSSRRRSEKRPILRPDESARNAMAMQMMIITRMTKMMRIKVTIQQTNEQLRKVFDFQSGKGRISRKGQQAVAVME